MIRRPTSLFLLALCLSCGDSDPAATDTHASETVAPDTLEPETIGPDTESSDTDAGEPPRTRCEELGAGHCMMPFPTDHFRVDDRLEFEDDLLIDDLPMGQFSGRDGYSRVTPLVFWFDGGALDGTASVVDIGRSLADDSPTVVLEAESGLRVPHWVEHDHFSVGKDEPVYTIRFPFPLKHATRYVVGVRDLVDGDGKLVAATEAFTAARDGDAGSRLKDVFAVLAADGHERAGLQLAWDFTTATADSATTRLLTLKDRVLDSDQTTITVDAVVDVGGPEIATRIEATANVPGVLLPPDDNGVRRLADEITGVEAIPIEIQIPHSVAGRVGPVPCLQYGHGLFGSRNEARNAWLQQFANRHGFVIVAADMMGMSESDIDVWGIVLTADIAALPALAEKPFQGFINHLAIARAMKSFTHAAVTIDPERVYYYGNSQGGTIGALLMTLQTDIERGVLGVPGGAYSMLLNRSTAFTQFSGLLTIPFPDSRAFSVVFTLLQTVIDPMDPLAYTHLMTNRVLLHVAKEDSQVQNDVSFLLGRSLGVPIMTPTPRPVFGLEEQAYPFEGSALVEYDFGKPDNPDPTAPPPSRHDTHADLRVLEIAQDQLWHFLETGEVVSVCDGPCDPD